MQLLSALMPAMLLLVKLVRSQLPLLQERHSYLYWFILSCLNKHPIPLAAFSLKDSEFLFKVWPLQIFITHTFLKRIPSAYVWYQREGLACGQSTSCPLKVSSCIFKLSPKGEAYALWELSRGAWQDCQWNR